MATPERNGHMDYDRPAVIQRNGSKYADLWQQDREAASAAVVQKMLDDMAASPTMRAFAAHNNEKIEPNSIHA